MCGGDPSSGKGEHVFPKWLQRRFDLWDERLTLLNGTLIPYKDLCVPCCIECNSGFLSAVENSVSCLDLDRGPIAEVDKLQIGRWMAKILLGILYKETQILLDRSKPSYGAIFPAEFLKEFYNLHLLVQTARKQIKLDCLHWEFPFSLYMYEIVESKSYDKFDFSTSISGESVALRIGNLGIIFVSDGGMQMEASSGGPFGLVNRLVHPLQFSELISRVHYKASLRNATHHYLNSEDEDCIHINQISLQSYSTTNLRENSVSMFRDWQDEEFYYCQRQFMGSIADSLYDKGTGAKYTLLVDKNGNFKELEH